LDGGFGPGARGAHPAVGDGDVEHVGQRPQLAVTQCRPCRDGAVGQLCREVGRVTTGDHGPLVKHDDAIGDRGCLLDLVGGEQDGGATVATCGQRGPEPATGVDVQPDGRLVEDEQRRIDDQRHRELEPLLLAAGQLGDPALRQAVQTYLGQDRVGVGCGSARADRPTRDQLADLQRAREAGLLVHDAQPAARGRPTGVVAVDPGDTGGRCEHPRQRADECRLARAVWAQQGHALAGCDGQVDTAQRVRRPVAVIQSTDRHDVVHGHLPGRNGDDRTFTGLANSG
jgi:hypothetical protein